VLRGHANHRRFDRRYVNAIRGWAFSENRVKWAVAHRKMLMLDFEFGENCSLRCGYCFRRKDVRDRGLKALDVTQTKNIIDQAIKLGVKSVHIVGKGEPLENEDSIEVIEHIHQKGAIPLVFTAGHIFGDDSKARKYHGCDGRQLAERLYELETSVIVKIHSLKQDVSDRIVGVSGKYPYTKFRDIGIDRLISTGFTKSGGKWLSPTRLGADILVLRQNYDEILDIYSMCRDENIYPLVVTFIPCGLTSRIFQRKRFDVSPQQKIELWKQIYKYNHEQGIKFEGVSAYAGGHQCLQLRYALYINVRGLVWSCPGEPDQFHLGSLVGSDSATLEEIWANAPRNMNYLCFPRLKCGSLPRDLRNTVERYVRTLPKH